jgi:hypothetical protein
LLRKDKTAYSMSNIVPSGVKEQVTVILPDSETVNKGETELEDLIVD